MESSYQSNCARVRVSIVLGLGLGLVLVLGLGLVLVHPPYRPPPQRPIPQGNELSGVIDLAYVVL